MKKIQLLALVLLLAPACFSQSPDRSADEAAIKATALNYVEGWYEGNPERMTKALHPDLAKRLATRDKETGKARLEPMTAEQLIGATGKGFGKKTPLDKQRKEVKVLDIFGDMASVRADMAGWVDYMQMAKIDGEWKIINVLWEPRPKQ